MYGILNRHFFKNQNFEIQIILTKWKSPVLHQGNKKDDNDIYILPTKKKQINAVV